MIIITIIALKWFSQIIASVGGGGGGGGGSSGCNGSGAFESAPSGGRLCERASGA